MTWYKLLTPSGHVLLNEYCESAASSAMPWQRHGHPADLFWPLLSVKPGAANPNGFLICGLCTINAPSPPSLDRDHGSALSCVCVCVRSLPLFSLTFPHCLPLRNRSVHWHVFVTLSLSAFHAWCVTLQRLRFSAPLLVLSVCGMGDSRSKQR